MIVANHWATDTAMLPESGPVASDSQRSITRIGNRAETVVAMPRVGGSRVPALINTRQQSVVRQQHLDLLEEIPMTRRKPDRARVATTMSTNVYCSIRLKETL